MLEYEKSIAFYESKCKNYEKVNLGMMEEENRVNDKIVSL